MAPSAQKDREVKKNEGMPEAENIVRSFVKVFSSGEHDFACEADD
jgi:hypothetical protein